MPCSSPRGMKTGVYGCRNEKRNCTAILASTEAFKSSRVHMHRTRGRDSIFNRREEGRRSPLLRTIVLVYNKTSLYLFRRYNPRLKIFLNDYEQAENLA
jgi:hypothetical protein